MREVRFSQKKFACLNISQVAGNLAVAATLGDLLAAGVVSHVDLSSVFLANALCSAPFPGNGPNASFAHDLAVLVVKFTWFGTYFDRILVETGVVWTSIGSGNAFGSGSIAATSIRSCCDTIGDFIFWPCLWGSEIFFYSCLLTSDVTGACTIGLHASVVVAHGAVPQRLGLSQDSPHNKNAFGCRCTYCLECCPGLPKISKRDTKKFIQNIVCLFLERSSTINATRPTARCAAVDAKECFCATAAPRPTAGTFVGGSICKGTQTSHPLHGASSCSRTAQKWACSIRTASTATTAAGWPTSWAVARAVSQSG
jgi:hypothetical protein